MTQSPTTDLVWARLSSAVRPFIRHRVADEHIAEDLLQEVFVRIHQHIRSVAHADRLDAWVYAIARNVVRDHYRRSAERPVSLEAADPAEEDESQLAALKCRSAEWLGELIDALPDRYREVLRLAEIEGLKQQEVASRLGLSLAATKSRIQRGRGMLRVALDQCCEFEFDRRGNLLDADPKPGRTVCQECD